MNLEAARLSYPVPYVQPDMNAVCEQIDMMVDQYEYRIVAMESLMVALIVAVWVFVIAIIGTIIAIIADSMRWAKSFRKTMDEFDVIMDRFNALELSIPFDYKPTGVDNISPINTLRTKFKAVDNLRHYLRNVHDECVIAEEAIAPLSDSTELTDDVKIRLTKAKEGLDRVDIMIKELPSATIEDFEGKTITIIEAMKLPEDPVPWSIKFIHKEFRTKILAFFKDIRSSFRFLDSSYKGLVEYHKKLKEHKAKLDTDRTADAPKIPAELKVELDALRDRIVKARKWYSESHRKTKGDGDRLNKLIDAFMPVYRKILEECKAKFSIKH